MDRIRNQNHALVAPACDSTATAWEMGNEDGVNTSITDVPGTKIVPGLSKVAFTFMYRRLRSSATSELEPR